MTADLTLRGAARVVAAVALPLALGGCDWFTDFKNQPRVEPWEPLSQADGDTIHPPRGNPQFSVPISGTAAAGFQVGYGALPGVVDSIAAIATNPTPVSGPSLENGRKHYTINCSVCHGDLGRGDGPATKYGMPGISITTDMTRGRSDGYIYGMIRNGRGLMPTYNRIEEMDRWDVVNYVRALQGAVPNSAGVGMVGYPGQTGATLPGPSRTAPTRPAPFGHAAAAGAAPAGEGAPAPAVPAGAPPPARDSAGRPAAGARPDAQAPTARPRGTP